MVSVLTAVERCWCSEPAGIHSFPTPELDRQVPKVTTGEESGGAGVGRRVKEHFIYAYSHQLTTL